MPFSVLFSFLQTVQTVLHITTKNQGSQPLKKGTSSSLGWVEGHHINDASGAFHQVKVETFNIFSVSILPKIIKKNLSFLNDVRLTNPGVCSLQNKRGTHNFTKT